MNHSTMLSYQDIRTATDNLITDFWKDFEEYLKNSYRESSIPCRLLYAKQYYRVILKGNAQSLLLLPNNKRLQVMKSLSVLSVYGML